MERHTCPICARAMQSAGSKRSQWSDQEFALSQCTVCHFSRVVDPRTDFAALYNEAYYRGHGADPLVDYHSEMEDPRSIRHLEWSGIEDVVGGLTTLNFSTRWLDIGCGLGGLVRHLQSRGYKNAYGFDEGYGADWGRSQGFPILDRTELEGRQNSFEVITAVEVIEHVTEPMEFLREIAGLLAPGGLLLLTTGNVEKVRGRLSDWSYIIPDVHVSFFGPTSLGIALEKVGLTTDRPNFQSGYEKVIRYKVLKNVRRTKIASWQQLIPWRVAARIIDRRYGVTALPVGRKI